MNNAAYIEDSSIINKILVHVDAKAGALTVGAQILNWSLPKLLLSPVVRMISRYGFLTPWSS